jgi:uncharacterized protein
VSPLILIVPIAILALALAALLGATYWWAWQLLHPRRTPAYAQPSDYGLVVEDIAFVSPRGLLHGWYLPARNGRTLLCCHGIGDSRSQWVPRIASLHAARGYGALMFDFAGHGDSGHSMVTYGARETLDVGAAIAYLRTRGDVDLDHLGILGLSLGAITATLAAARQSELRAVVLESGFADLTRDLSKVFHRFTGLPAFPFAPLVVLWGQRIGRVRLSEIRPERVIGVISPRAVMVISDLNDALADEPYDGEQLYAHAGEPKVLWQVPGAEHVRSFETAPEEWLRRVGEFLDAALSDGTLATESARPELVAEPAARPEAVEEA